MFSENSPAHRLYADKQPVEVSFTKRSFSHKTTKPRRTAFSDITVVGGAHICRGFASRGLSLSRLFHVLIFLLLPAVAHAQYYDWGQDPASTKWRTIETRDLRYIFPKDYGRQAVRTMHYLDTIRPHISFGFRHGPMRRTPLVMHTRNFQSNGIVMLAPRRIELITTPGVDQFAFPWLKQLAAHEYRHAVQYNNLNRGMIRPLMWLLGQQGEFVGLAFLPVWAMEGDAVMAETQMSSFGRGLQPSFSIEYRAMIMEGPRPKRIDTWFSGSYRHFMPDHYQLGYQIMSWAWGRYGENVLDKTSWFASRNPWMICPFTIALKKYYGITTGRMFTESFAALEEYWRSMPLEDNSAQIIETPRTSHTIYTSPRAVNGGIVALKEDLDNIARLVMVKDGREQVLCRTGIVNSPLALLGSTVYWTEMRQSAVWEQKVGSVLCSYDLEAGLKNIHREHSNVLFPTAMRDELAWVEYDPAGSYTIKEGGQGNINNISARHPREWPIADSISVHGLAYEGKSGNFYFIALNDAGMWIGETDSSDSAQYASQSADNIRQLTQPSRTTISNLTAGDGKLWFNSIASGKDEAHMFDLATGREYRITTSRYGSFAPSPTDDGIVLTTYTPEGYLLSRQDSLTLHEVEHAELPQNTLNPIYADWDVPNLDHIKVADTTSRPVKKYRRGLHLFNFHSWAPAYFEPEELSSETRLNIQVGAVAMSQNAINSAYTELGYGHTGRHSIAHAKFRYMGWAPKIELQARWADIPQLVYGRMTTNDPLPERLSDRWELSAFVYLPLTLSSGSHLRTLTPNVKWIYHNASLFEPGDNNADKGTYNTGMNQLSLGIQYSDKRRMAHRNIAPRLGYTARVGYTSNPLNDEFGRLWSASAHLWLPGIGRHHSLHIGGAWQYQNPRKYTYGLKDLFPRGADYNAVRPARYYATSANYALPVAYPDGGINSLLYVRRIRLSLGFDWARMRNMSRYLDVVPMPWQDVWSYGGELSFDMAPLRLPATTEATFTMGIFKPSDSRDVSFSMGFAMPF